MGGNKVYRQAWRMMAGIIILSILCIFLLVRMHIYKTNIRNIKEELKRTLEDDYNRQLRVTLFDRELTELVKQLNKNLDHQKKLKQQAERSKNELKQSVSDIAHDIRTPLTVIKGNLQLMEKEEMSVKARDYLGISINNADALKKMTDEFFELSVIESDSRPVELKKIDIIDFISEFIIENEALIRGKELEPEIVFPDKPVYVMADREMLLRVFGNLLNNIVKYAKDSFTVKIVEREKEALTAKDHGRADLLESAKEHEAGFIRVIFENALHGNEDIDTARIFERTYRADKARKSEGAGLGLYIAKLLLEKQGAGISAKVMEDRLVFEIVLSK